jgi:hypothetical protein
MLLTGTHVILKLSIVVLCLGAVSFLLRVLVALVREALTAPPQSVKAYLARFNPRREQKELIVMKLAAVKRGYPTRTVEYQPRLSLGRR